MKFRNPFAKTPPDTTPSELIVIGRNDAKTLAAKKLIETIGDEKAKARRSPLPDAGVDPKDFDLGGKRRRPPGVQGGRRSGMLLEVPTRRR